MALQIVMTLVMPITITTVTTFKLVMIKIMTIIAMLMVMRI